MIALFRNEKSIYKFVSIGIFVSILYFVVKIVYAGIIALPYPKEILEPANVALTNLFIEGKNPYTLESLTWVVPGINYDYPFLNSFVASVISRCFCCNAVVAHFVLSLFSILASGILGFVMVKDHAKTTILPLLATILFMFCHWRYGYISAAPDDFGLLLYLLTMYASVSKLVKNKPLICSIGITLCFYTKQYMVFVCLPIFIYMFFYSRNDAKRLILLTIIINMVVAGVVWLVMPLYFVKAFLFTFLGTVGGGGSEIATFIEQFKYLIALFASLFVVILVAFFVFIKKIIINKGRFRGIIKVKENDPFALCAGSSFIIMVPLFIIGRNDGAFISYFLQLWMPSIVVVALLSLERMIPEKHESLRVIIYPMIAAFTIYFGFGKLPLHILSNEEIHNWEIAYGYLEKYCEEGDIFYSRSLSYRGFIRQNGDWLCGHEGEVSEKTLSALEKTGVNTDYFRGIRELISQNIRYRNSIVEKIKRQDYSLITVENTPGLSLIQLQNCEDYGYTHIDSIELQLGNMPYEVDFYAR